MYAIRSYYELGGERGVLPPLRLADGDPGRLVGRAAGHAAPHHAGLGRLEAGDRVGAPEVRNRVRQLRRDLDRDRVLVGRITSYNVCYTKLLRTARSR